MGTKIDNLAKEIMDGLKEYADLATDDVKKAVRKAGNSVRKEISESAPKDTGKYSKSWTVKKTKETSNSLEVTVHSKNRYQLAHLLEHGHANEVAEECLQDLILLRQKNRLSKFLKKKSIKHSEVDDGRSYKNLKRDRHSFCL